MFDVCGPQMGILGKELLCLGELSPAWSLSLISFMTA